MFTKLMIKLKILVKHFRKPPFSMLDYQYIADLFLEIFNAEVVAVNFFEEKRSVMRTEAVSISIDIKDEFNEIFKRLDFNPVGRDWPVDVAQIAAHKTAAFNKIAGLYELFFGNLPVETCQAMEGQLRIGEIYGVGIVYQEQVLGNVIVILPQGKRLINTKLMQRVANEMGAAFWRLKLEQSLNEAEERYDSLIEHSRDAIFVATAAGRYLKVNQAACQLLGYERTELLRMGIPDVTSIMSLPCFDSLKTNGSFLGEIALTHKDGRDIVCEINSNILPDGNYLGIVRDVSERKKMEESILKNQKLESIGILAGGIAHDFNNYLTGILATIQLMELSYQNGKDIAKYFQTLKQSVDRSCSLTRQLLTFSKGGNPVRDVIMLTDLIKDTVDLSLRGSIMESDLKIAGDLWPVHADKGQISQVLSNLMINACQSMPNGGLVTVEAGNITLGVHDDLPVKSGKYVKIVIQDHGVGIPQAYLGRVFEPFFTTKPKGNGLGLAISYSIIKQHEGYIQVDSEEGAGTTFVIYLPAVVQAPARKNKDVPSTNVLQGIGKILIMDDDVTIRDVIGELLTVSGYEVEITGDGAKTIEVYKKAKNAGEPFDVVIMDLTIPGGMGGLETLNQLKKFDPQIKTIVSSGYFNHPILSNHKKYGYNGVITKPFKIEELLKLLASIIEEDDY